MSRRSGNSLRVSGVVKFKVFWSWTSYCYAAMLEVLLAENSTTMGLSQQGENNERPFWSWLPMGLRLRLSGNHMGKMMRV